MNKNPSLSLSGFPRAVLAPVGAPVIAPVRAPMLAPVRALVFAPVRASVLAPVRAVRGQCAWTGAARSAVCLVS